MKNNRNKNLLLLGVAGIALYALTQSEKTVDVSAEPLPDPVKSPQVNQPTTPAPVKVVGKNLIALRDTTVFEATDSTKVSKKVKAGDVIGQKVKSCMITSKGVKTVYHLVEWKTLIFLTTQGLVKASDTKEG